MRPAGSPLSRFLKNLIAILLRTKEINARNQLILPRKKFVLVNIILFSVEFILGYKKVINFELHEDVEIQKYMLRILSLKLWTVEMNR
jgi:hypothetical protein